jgi:hypothetical protein
MRCRAGSSDEIHKLVAGYHQPEPAHSRRPYSAARDRKRRRAPPLLLSSSVCLVLRPGWGWQDAADQSAFWLCFMLCATMLARTPSEDYPSPSPHPSVPTPTYNPHPPTCTDSMSFSNPSSVLPYSLYSTWECPV